MRIATVNRSERIFRLYKTVFPAGIDSYATPTASRTATPFLDTHIDSSSDNTAHQTHSTSTFFGLGIFGGSAKPVANPVNTPDGPIEEFIMSGTAFGEHKSERILYP